MNNARSLIRRTVASAAAGTAALVLAACGGRNGDGDGDGGSGHDGHAAGSPSAAASQGQHNAVDVDFAKGMIPHHRQAVEMSDLAASRAESPEVRKLAQEIEKAQDPEIKTLSDWLKSWDEKVPAEGGMDHSMHGMEGMMSAEDMEQLKKSSGTAFDTAFLKMMIKHHEGAVAMAKTEQANGAYGPAAKMADDIAASQSAEIAGMNTLLRKN